MNSESPYLVISVVLDESGSMRAQQKETIQALNDYIQKLKEDHADKKVLFSLTQFNTQAHVIHAAQPLKNIPLLTEKTYLPNGFTALYDAVGQTIIELSKRVEQEGNVLVVILTDGHENSSQEYDLQAIQSLIEEKKKEEWSFVFMGADKSAWKVGSAMGTQSAVHFDAYDMVGTMDAMYIGTHSFIESEGLTAQERSVAYTDAYLRKEKKETTSDPGVNIDFDNIDIETKNEEEKNN